MRSPMIIRLAALLPLVAAFAGPLAADDAVIEPAEVDLGRPVDFVQDIHPILEANCIACHNAIIDEGKLDLEEYEGLIQGGGRGAAVVPNDPEQSLFYQVVTRAQEPAMPPIPNDSEAKALTPQQVGLVRQWILEGAAGGARSMSRELVWQPIPPELKSIYSVALSPWGRFAAAGRANGIRVYDLATGTETAALTDPSLLSIEHAGAPMYGEGAAHRDFVHSLAFSPDGTLLASGGYRVVKLWKRDRDVRTRDWTVPEAVTAVAVSPDGQWAAVAAADHVIRLWNLADGEPVAELAGHAGTITGLRFSADGQSLVSCSLDQSLRTWSLPGGEPGVQIDAPSPLNDVALNLDGSRIFSAGADNLIRVWSADPAAEAPEEIRQIPGHGGPVTSLDLILPAGTQLLSGSEDGTVRVWDIESGNQVRAMGHGGPVTAVASRPDGQALASAGANHVKLWTAENGEQRAELKGDQRTARNVILMTEEDAVAKQLTARANAAVEAAGKNVEDREGALKSAAEAKEAADKTLAEAEPKVKETEEALTAARNELEQNPEDEALKTKVAEAEKAHDEAAAALKTATETQAAAVRSLEIAEKAVETAKGQLAEANERKDAAAQHEQQATERLAQAQQENAEAEKPFRSLAFSRDGRLLAAGGDSQAIHLWDGDQGRPLDVLAGHEGAVAGLAFGPDQTLVSGGADRQAAAWNVNPPWRLIGQLGPAEDAPLDLGPSPFVGRVLALAFSPDGRLLATGGGDPSRSGEVMLWNVEDRTLAREIEDAHSDTVQGLEFSRDGRLLVSGAADKFVKIFEVETGQHVRSFEGHTHHVLDVAWKADAGTVASAGADNTIKVWNVETGEQARTIANYQKEVTSIQFIGTGDHTVSCGGDATVRLHNTANGQNFRNFGGGTDFMYAAAATRDEAVVVAGGEDGVLRVWNGANAQLLYTFEPPPPPDEDVQASAQP